eukprot:1115123-Prorocentrum_minimum.AAC.4
MRPRAPTPGSIARHLGAAPHLALAQVGELDERVAQPWVLRAECSLLIYGERIKDTKLQLSYYTILVQSARRARRILSQADGSGEQWEKVGNGTQGEKRGRVSGGVLSAPLPLLLAQEDDPLNEGML